MASLDPKPGTPPGQHLSPTNNPLGQGWIKVDVDSGESWAYTQDPANGLWVPKAIPTPVAEAYVEKIIEGLKQFIDDPHQLDNDIWTWDEGTNSYVSKYDLKANKIATVKTTYNSSTLDTEISTTWDEPPSPSIDGQLSKLFPALFNYYIDCPECVKEHHKRFLSSCIQHLNDSHRWTREQIADWLETLDVDLTLSATNEGR